MVWEREAPISKNNGFFFHWCYRWKEQKLRILNNVPHHRKLLNFYGKSPIIKKGRKSVPEMCLFRFKMLFGYYLNWKFWWTAKIQFQAFFVTYLFSKNNFDFVQHFLLRASILTQFRLRSHEIFMLSCYQGAFKSNHTWIWTKINSKKNDAKHTNHK